MDVLERIIITMVITILFVIVSLDAYYSDFYRVEDHIFRIKLFER